MGLVAPGPWAEDETSGATPAHLHLTESPLQRDLLTGLLYPHPLGPNELLPVMPGTSLDVQTKLMQ